MAEQDAPYVSAVLSRIAAVLRTRDSDGSLNVAVDGTAITAGAHGRAARLTCVLADALPDDEAALRRLMHQYLAYADHGAEVLCADEAGRLMLVATVLPNDDVPARTAEFCDAAVHWRRVAQDGAATMPGRSPGTASDGLAERLLPMMIFP